MTALQRTVGRILEAVRLEGDRALLRYTAGLDHVRLTPRTLRVGAGELAGSVRKVDPATRRALQRAADNIGRFARRQAARYKVGGVTEGMGPRLRGDDGIGVGERIRPIGRVGVYVPGGRFAYPSTVLMTALVARAAGVRDVAVAVPPGGATPEVLYAARLAGVTEVYRMGGAQAIAAFAYGTRTIRRVDKIVGPGNRYVTEAKRQVFGRVGIDMLAGPSELAVIADDSADARAVAADLLAQAEHDPQARGAVFTPSARLAAEVRSRIGKNGQITVRRVGSLEAALEAAGRMAAEHVEIITRSPERLLGGLGPAGAVFLGPHTPAVLGDYWAGPSHVLPTGGAARFLSGLGVEQFLVRSSVVQASRRALRLASAAVIRMAEAEGLKAHADSVRVRLGRRVGR